MNKIFISIAFFFLLLGGMKLPAQDLRFNQVLKNSLGQISDAAQDKQGIFWFINTEKGLLRYDGVNLKNYKNDPKNPNSITAGLLTGRIFVDAENKIWLGTLGSGLERFDPATNTFTHFRHNEKDAASLRNDTVIFAQEDRTGNLWVGTFGGLSLLDRKTGKFKHYRHDPKDPSSISPDAMLGMYEDKKGTLWIIGRKVIIGQTPSPGVLNRFDRTTGKFTHYFQDSTKSNNSIPGKFIVYIYEDNKNNFWIGTDAGLYNMDRDKALFTRYYPDPFNSSTLSTVPVAEKAVSLITFITEDSSGALWIGLGYSGINRYDPITKKSTHFGYIYEGSKLLSSKDTATGFTGNYAFRALNSKDGLFWVLGRGGVFNMNYKKTTIPFYPLKRDAFALYLEAKTNTLWIGTESGLLRKNLYTQKEKLFTHDPKNKNSLAGNNISSMRVDEKGNLWLGTRTGLDKFNPLTEQFTHYQHDPKKPRSISDNFLNYLYIDHNKNLWIASETSISRMDQTTEQFTNFKIEKNSIKYTDGVVGIVEDREHAIWASTGKGAIRLNVKTGKINRYLPYSIINSICVDTKGIIWAGGTDGLYAYNRAKDEFTVFANNQSEVPFDDVINIIEDNQQNLWVSTSSLIIKISADRTKVKKFSEANGIRSTNFGYNDNYKAPDGRLFIGIEKGYYSFYPDQIKEYSTPPLLNITSFKLGETLIKTGSGSILTAPIWQTDELRLNHYQNAFSFDFLAVDYINSGEIKYLFILENYDHTWHDIGSDHRASFFNVPPGAYAFRVKAVSADGAMVEKSIQIIISPPWWRTWWAYCLYTLLAIISGYLIYQFQKDYIIKRERERSQQKELAQAKEIEKAYHELKITQAQLIQSEKLASLGELTAGIAHEIQNPLNFVNNFAEVSAEMLGEMEEELDKGDTQEAKAIAADLKQNLSKINHHGKRASSIVKGMLEHSRASTGVKEPTDLNAMADEYLRLAYHGLRAKDNNFNATLETHFDPDLPLVSVIPQDIGRVLLNLINNAFYAVQQRTVETLHATSLQHLPYQPTVTISTKRLGNAIEIHVKDNGNGIPDAIKDKIFQPFFTTKPTGQGTGLGLSLAYDIVTKGHGGSVNLESTEAGTLFIIRFPA